MARKQLSSWLFSPYDSISVHGTHRRWLVIDEDEDYCRKTFKQLTHIAPSQLKIAAFDATELGGKKRAKLLGNEFDISVLFAHRGFRVGDLMALAGTVKRSGCFILCCPPFTQWPRTYIANSISHGYQLTYSAYIARFIGKIEQATWIARHNKLATYLPPNNVVKANIDRSINAPRDSTNGSFASADQQHAYSELISQWSKDNVNAVISAPRGRGKSSVLGLLIAALSQQGMRVCITSTLIENAERIFHHAQQCKGVTVVSATRVVHTQTNGSIEWVAPDNPVLYNNVFDALIIDEAASLPLPNLLKILQQHKKWVLSTTTQGYEGSGQGFMHKLMPALKSRHSIYLTLDTPLRWYSGDLIEEFLNDVCLFNTDTPDDSSDNMALLAKDFKHRAACDITYRIARFSDLLEHEIVSAMALLTLAHYQTTPDDAMRLLDSPDTTLCVQTLRNVITGVAVINYEGGSMLTSIGKAIAEGSRRPKGHLSAQRIALKTLQACDADKLYWRISRIAIAPSLQRFGLGSKLLSHITAAARDGSIDAVTTSYGATSALNRFWETNGFTIVDKGLKPNKASGETSALALKPLSMLGHEVTARLINIQHIECNRAPLSHYDSESQSIIVNKIQAFISGYRPLEATWPYINILTKHNKETANAKVLKPTFTLLDSKHINMNALEQVFNVQGKRAVTRCIKKEMLTLLTALNSPNSVG